MTITLFVKVLKVNELHMCRIQQYVKEMLQNEEVMKEYLKNYKMKGTIIRNTQ